MGWVRVWVWVWGSGFGIGDFKLWYCEMGFIWKVFEIFSQSDGFLDFL